MSPQELSFFVTTGTQTPCFTRKSNDEFVPAARAPSSGFSLGAIVYEMATGKRAFVRDSATQTLNAIIEDEPELVTLVNPKVAGHDRPGDRPVPLEGSSRTLRLHMGHRVRSKYSCGFPMVETEQPAKPFTGAHLAFGLM